MVGPQTVYMVFEHWNVWIYCDVCGQDLITGDKYFECSHAPHDWLACAECSYALAWLSAKHPKNPPTDWREGLGLSCVWPHIWSGSGYLADEDKDENADTKVVRRKGRSLGNKGLMRKPGHFNMFSDQSSVCTASSSVQHFAAFLPVSAGSFFVQGSECLEPPIDSECLESSHGKPLVQDGLGNCFHDGQS